MEEPTVKEHAGLPEGTGVGVEGAGEGVEGTGADGVGVEGVGVEGVEGAGVGVEGTGLTTGGSPDTLPGFSIGPWPRPELTAPLIVALPIALCLYIVPFTMGP